MADPKLERYRQRLREEEEKKGGNRSSSSGDNASYPYWNIPDKATAVIRFLPDKDENNPWGFSVERQTIRLPFSGIVGGEFPTDKPQTVTVPCVDMFGDTCPIIAETRPWWKDEAKKETARRYYKKRSNITQGFVVSSPFDEPNAPENPIRRLMIGTELLAKIKAGMADPDMEYMPTDYLNGCDFRICKSIKRSEGRDFNNYGTSSWARRPRPLSEAEQIAIQQYGLFNLADFLGPRPDADGIAAIKAMFHASLAGNPYDMAAFGKYPWRPYGSNGSAVSTVTSSSDDEVDDFSTTAINTGISKVETSVAASDKPHPQDILAKLREKTANRG